MKTFDQLSPAQQEKAAEHELTLLLQSVVEGATRFNDALNGDGLQARIDKAISKANDLQTPWFAHEHVMEACREDLVALAQPAAQDALYPEEGEYVSRAALG